MTGFGENADRRRQVRKFGYVARLESDEEYIAAMNSRLHEESKKEAEQKRPSVEANNPSSSNPCENRERGELQETLKNADNWQPPAISQPSTQYNQLPAPAEFTQDWGTRGYVPDFRPRETRYIVPDHHYRRRRSEQDFRPQFGDPRRQRWCDQDCSYSGRRPEPERKRHGKSANLVHKLPGLLVHILGS
jgi:hypothetical protein